MLTLTDNIVELNRDVEPLLVQGKVSRTRFFKEKFDDKFKPLQFVHSSDIHARLDLWNRMIEYVNYYHDYIDFVLHTGDYCGHSQDRYVDLYNNGIFCDRTIYTCVGNHDTVHTDNLLKNSKEAAHRLLFAPIDYSESEIDFMDCDFSMTYYKDFPESNIRMIVLDLYYDIDAQCKWLKRVLADALEKGICVITAMHEPSGNVNDSFGVTFHSKNDYISLCGPLAQQPFEPIIADFVAGGGCHICNLAGHEHHDLFGLTDAGLLNSAVQCGTAWDGWCDGTRTRSTRTFDCFNVISIDTNLGLFKIARIGNNRDNFFRSQRSLCYDYINKKVIYND